jgi:hypothetical protein
MEHSLVVAAQTLMCDTSVLMRAPLCLCLLPAQFFQGNQDNGWNDAVQYATVAALLYLAFRAFSELEKLN